MRAFFPLIFLLLQLAPPLLSATQVSGSESALVNTCREAGSGVSPRQEQRFLTDHVIQEMVDGVEECNLEAGVRTLEEFGTRHSLYLGGYEASLWIKRTFEDFGYTDVSLHDYNDWNDNVVCIKPGVVHPDRYVVIGGHYDSMGFFDGREAPGADDNASGTTAVLEIARAFADVDFKESVVFIAFSGEEQGLVGSESWAAAAADSGLNIVGMINLDMICYAPLGDPKELDIIANEASAQLADLAICSIATYVPEHVLLYNNLGIGGSDHVSFWAQGFPAIHLTEDLVNISPFIHSPEDRIGQSANDFEFMLSNVRAALAIAAVLARPFHLTIVHSPQNSASGSGPFVQNATILSARPLDPASLRLIYRIDYGLVQSRPLVPTGTPGTYTATIPVSARGVLVEYYLTATDESGNVGFSPENAPDNMHSFYTGVTTVAKDDFEINRGWTLGLFDDDATSGLWTWADPVGTAYQPEDDHTPSSGRYCFVTGNAGPDDPAGANDVDGGRTTLLSPLYNLSRAIWAELSYWRWYADETYPDDLFCVDISNDGGETWVNLERISGSTYPWRQAKFTDLGSILHLTGKMRLRFVAEDQGNGSLVEALIDDLKLLAIFRAPDQNEPEVPVHHARLAAFPNPFNPRTRLSFEIPEAGLTEIRIYDTSGAEVDVIDAGVLDAGPHERLWGAPGLPSGIYLARLTLDGNALLTRKLTLLR